MAGGMVITSGGLVQEIAVCLFGGEFVVVTPEGSLAFSESKSSAHVQPSFQGYATNFVVQLALRYQHKQSNEDKTNEPHHVAYNDTH